MMTLRFKSALLHAVMAAALVFFCGLFLNALYHHKQNRMLLEQSHYFAHLISTDQVILNYLDRSNLSVTREEMQKSLHRYFDHNNSIYSFSIRDAFEKVLLTVNKKSQNELSSYEQSELKNENQIIPGDFSELIVPLFSNTGLELGKIKIKWEQNRIFQFQNVIQNSTILFAGISFLMVYLVSYLLLLKRYSKEHNLLSTKLGHAISGDFSNRLETRLFSKEIAELSTYFNRVLSELEESRKQKLLSQDSYSQLDRRYHESLKKIDKRDQQIQVIYNEVQEGIHRLFSLFTCGLMIVDHELNIQWKNTHAEKLLRFAKIEDDKIVDERIKRCLAPLVRFQTTNLIDDICAWPQPSLGCAVSCKIRSVAVPTPDASKLFFVTIEEDSGFPQQRTPEFFSHRLVVDILSESNNDRENSSSFDDSTIKNDRLWACLSRIERYQLMDKGAEDHVVSIKITSWFQQYMEHHSKLREQYHILPLNTESDISIKVGENAFSTLIDMVLEIIAMNNHKPDDTEKNPTSIRSYWNARGKPVIEFLIPDIDQKNIQYFKDIFNGRVPLYCDQLNDNPIDIEKLEHDIRLTIFQYLRQHFRVYTECMYSSGKQVGVVRIVMEKFLFHEKLPPVIDDKNNSDQPSHQENKKDGVIKNILQDFLGNGDPVRY